MHFYQIKFSLEDFRIKGIFLFNILLFWWFRASSIWSRGKCLTTERVWCVAEEAETRLGDRGSIPIDREGLRRQAGGAPRTQRRRRRRPRPHQPRWSRRHPKRESPSLHQREGAASRKEKDPSEGPQAGSVEVRPPSLCLCVSPPPPGRLDSSQETSVGTGPSSSCPSIHPPARPPPPSV